jgi:hypothetical protein
MPLSDLIGIYEALSSQCSIPRMYGTRDRLEGKVCGIPHLAKNERDTPNFLQPAPDKPTCAPFFRKAHGVCGIHETSQKIGDVGHPIFCCLDRNCRSLHGTPHGSPGQAGQVGFAWSL